VRGRGEVGTQTAARRRFRSTFALGIARDLRKKDRLGVSVAGGKSSKSKNAWAGLVELLYRRQIGKSLIISPDVEFVTHSNAGALEIAGVRVGMSF
jgi:hypothetical protein